MYLCTPYLSTNEAAKLGGKKKNLEEIQRNIVTMSCNPKKIPA